MTMRLRVEAVRSSLLWRLNTRIIARGVKSLPPDTLKSYIVVTPHLVHLAPLATLNHGPRVQPVLVANGLSEADITWLSEMTDAPVIRLKSSLGRSPDSLLAHGTIIDYLADTNPGAFCIQDADCFISDQSFWNSVNIDLSSEYAVCAFVRNGDGDRADFPETFLTILNAPLMREYRRNHDVTSESSSRVSPRAQQALSEAGYPAGRVLETLKDYYDTLQQFWVVATHHGFRFRQIPGEGSTVHHIGGTSYLYRAFDNLDHWDYWPLAVHYLNLRILESPKTSVFRQRFAGLFEFHGSADQLLIKYPAFASGWRRQTSERIIAALLR